ncbi:hypothetical protein DFH07DRAFT_773118 [Mycena maculata]|uniref:Uncharacterized protein n=1 Tax=Mycena maculata TaxID=230809 RepID=A0AAD7J7Y1_9AGAR|nr:hypothetical protein DFH07DRAFT_773118 [Mycena maculata]
MLRHTQLFVFTKMSSKLLIVQLTGNIARVRGLRAIPGTNSAESQLYYASGQKFEFHVNPRGTHLARVRNISCLQRVVDGRSTEETKAGISSDAYMHVNLFGEDLCGYCFQGQNNQIVLKMQGIGPGIKSGNQFVDMGDNNNSYLYLLLNRFIEVLEVERTKICAERLANTEIDLKVGIVGIGKLHFDGKEIMNAARNVHGDISGNIAPNFLDEAVKHIIDVLPMACIRVVWRPLAGDTFRTKIGTAENGTCRTLIIASRVGMIQLLRTLKLRVARGSLENCSATLRCGYDEMLDCTSV